MAKAEAALLAELNERLAELKAENAARGGGGGSLWNQRNSIVEPRQRPPRAAPWSSIRHPLALLPLPPKVRFHPLVFFLSSSR
jgi:hypothetical protein